MVHDQPALTVIDVIIFNAILFLNTSITRDSIIHVD
jgi:hypothetical protein